MSDLDLTEAIEAVRGHGLPWVADDANGTYSCLADGCGFSVSGSGAADDAEPEHFLSLAAPLIAAQVRAQIAATIEAAAVGQPAMWRAGIACAADIARGES